MNPYGLLLWNILKVILQNRNIMTIEKQIERPITISIICGLYFINYLSPFFLFLFLKTTSPTINIEINWFGSTNDLWGFSIWAIKIIGLFGLFAMRKWGVWLFIFSFILIVTRNLIGGSIWPDSYGLINIIYIINMAFHILLIIFSVKYYKIMKV